MDGTPYVFSKIPMIYEQIRTWLSSRLQINPMEIRIVGSARTGFSLAPSPEFGKSFTSNSDLDITVISSNLFTKCQEEFESWKRDYESNSVSPRNQMEKYYWSENSIRVSKTLARGFIDPNKIPTFNKYPFSQNLAETMYLLKEKLEVTQSAPKICKATIRVYNTWKSFHKQVKLNINHSLASSNSKSKNF